VRRPGWNPIRRNRKLGTSSSGHGLDNRLVIPESRRDSRLFWEKLRDAVRLDINGFAFLVEPCLPGFVHAVTVDDAVRLLALLPPDDLTTLRAVVFRQPTRKQTILRPVWGRLAYFAEIGSMQGPAVILEAHPVDDRYEHTRSLSPDEAEELERLRADGHVVTGGPRFRIQTSLASTRSTQLFRTLPHEIGHLVHYEREVRLRANGDALAEVALRDQFFTRPAREKEDFAHRYARKVVAALSASHRLPFPRLDDPKRMRRQSLDPAWFGVGS
jgi:hypothetical protein